MDRRTAIRTASVLTLLGLTGIDKIFSATRKSLPMANSFHSFKLGTLDLMVVTDGHILMKPVQPNFAPGIPAAEVETLLKDNFASTKEVDLGINILIVKKDDKTILIDTGCGANFGKDSGWLTDNLKRAGIATATITDVVISHAHPDHIGGLTNAAGKLVFPNAKIYLSKIEHDFWMNGEPDFSKSKIKDEALKKLVVNVARKNIIAVKKTLHLFNDGETLLNCIKLKLAPGHTPGHTVTEIFSAGESLFHVADLVHSPILVFEHPEWGFEGDTDFELAVQSREKVLQQLTDTRTMVFSYHLPWPGIGHVKQKGKGFEWVQVPSALPD